MARPTDPAKLAAYLARQAANSRAYRERQAAKAAGQKPAPLKQPPRYRPPAVSGAVQRAFQTAVEARARRAEIISSLPSVRNPEVPIYVPREAPRAPAVNLTAAGQKRQAERIRTADKAKRLQAVGRSRKEMIVAELSSGSVATRLTDTMDDDQQRRFQTAANRLGAVSQQALAIVFLYEGGQGDYNSAIERILASPESRDVEEGLDKMNELANLAERADRMYAPSQIGRLTV